jgi:catechol 2,3-dioxygenase-like lactoylglutathione lyase family enzyme
MRFKGIHHIALITGNMEATIRFWRDLLGMRLISGFGEAGFRQYFFEVDEGTALSFFEWEGAQPAARKLHGRPVSGPLAFDHLAFELDSADAVWTLKDRLEAAGFPCSDMIDHGSFHAVYSFDPNGVPIEFCCARAGEGARHEPALHDADPPPAALEGPEPQPGKWPEAVKSRPAAERQVKDGDSSGFFQQWAGR